MKVTILDAAERDLEEGYRFYERQSPGLGSYFLDSLYSDVGLCATQAGYGKGWWWIDVGDGIPVAVGQETVDNGIRLRRGQILLNRPGRAGLLIADDLHDLPLDAR